MTSDSRTTIELLDAWHGGDQDALIELVQRHVPWLRAYVRRRMTQEMRHFETSEDVVQTVLYNLLRYGPAFRPENEIQFRALIAKSVLNRLCDLHDYVTADKRNPAREERLPSVISRIGKGAASHDRPERQTETDEERGFIALAMQLVDPEDRRIIQLYEFDDVEFAEIGRRLSISEDAARQRFHRAVRRLGEQVQRLKAGQLDDLARELDEPSKDAGSPRGD